MQAWWEMLTVFERIMFLVASPATLIMLIQTILLIIGSVGHGLDLDASGSDTSGIEMHGGDVGDSTGHTDVSEVVDHGLRLFTIRGIMAFFSIGGWAGFVFAISGASEVISLIIALVFGFAALFAMAWLMLGLLSLQENGTMRIENTINKEATVYIPIPAAKSGVGKVQVMVNESLTELSAMTTDGKPLKTGQTVKVTGTMGNILIVERDK